MRKNYILFTFINNNDPYGNVSSLKFDVIFKGFLFFVFWNLDRYLLFSLYFCVLNLGYTQMGGIRRIRMGGI